MLWEIVVTLGKVTSSCLARLGDRKQVINQKQITMDSTNNDLSTKPAIDGNNVLAPVLLLRDRMHSHFWIEDGELFESYHTIRGLRYRHRFAVNGLPDTDKCLPDMIKYIEAEYLS